MTGPQEPAGERPASGPGSVYTVGQSVPAARVEGQGIPQWQVLLATGIVLWIVAGMMLSGYHSSVRSGIPNDNLLGWGLVVAAVGFIVLVPGLVGWGLIASELLQRQPDQRAETPPGDS